MIGRSERRTGERERRCRGGRDPNGEAGAFPESGTIDVHHPAVQLRQTPNEGESNSESATRPIHALACLKEKIEYPWQCVR